MSGKNRLNSIRNKIKVRRILPNEEERVINKVLTL